MLWGGMCCWCIMTIRICMSPRGRRPLIGHAHINWQTLAKDAEKKRERGSEALEAMQLLLKCPFPFHSLYQLLNTKRQVGSGRESRGGGGRVTRRPQGKLATRQR